MDCYAAELEEKILNFKRDHGRFPSKILMTRAIFEELKNELKNLLHTTYVSAPMSASTMPEFCGIVIEIDDLILF